MDKVDSFLTSYDFKMNKARYELYKKERSRAKKIKIIKEVIFTTIFTLLLVFLPAIIEAII